MRYALNISNFAFCFLMIITLLTITRQASIKTQVAIKLADKPTSDSGEGEGEGIELEPIIPEPCDDEPNDNKPKNFHDGLMSPPGRFISCIPTGLIQMIQMKQDKNEEFHFKKNDDLWSINVKTRQNYFAINGNMFHCMGNKSDDSSKLKLTFLDENRVVIEVPPKYASTRSPYMGIAVDNQTKSEIFWLTSIPHHPVSRRQVIPDAACRNPQCSEGVLRFTTGWFVNGILDACPTEKILDLYTYRAKRARNDTDQDFIVIGYGKGEYFLYVTPDGQLSNLVKTQTRYSLFRKINKENGTFLLQAWNGYYLGHTLGKTHKEQKIILIKEETSNMIIFGYDD